MPSGPGVVVVGVIDGDTVEVRLGAANETVRLIGINSPERGECFADEAGAALRTLVDGKEVTMTADVSDRDRFGRLLRYLWIGELMVNEELVRRGHAIARRYPPDEAHAERLAAAQVAAEGDGAGLWAADACGTPLAGTSLRIVHIEYDAPGNDHENLNGEWVDIRNDGGEVVALGGWVLKDESSSHRYRFPDGFRLDGGATVRVHTGCGDDTDLVLYWCNRSSAVWNNDGDTGFLLDPGGNIVHSLRY